jgi:hypothetical protein
MKKSWLVILVSLFCLAGVASADSLQVNNAAAMGGTGTACSGNNCGLEVLHDNTSAAYVQDNTPNDETVFRGSFLFNPNSISPETVNFRHPIFNAIGTNPNPNVGDCNAAANANALRIWLYCIGGSGQNYTIQAWANGNQCGARATNRLPIASDQPVRICWEMTTGNSNTGEIALAIVDDADPCPTSGDGAWDTRSLTNGLVDVDLVRMGSTGTNNFGAGANGSMYFDEYESFRTLTP